MEKSNTNAVESTAKITYQFTAVPTNLIYLLDSDCLKLLTLLIQEHSYWNSKNRLENGYFFKSIEEVQNILFMKNDQDVRLTIESLYVNKFIDIVMLGKKHQSNKFKINWNKIEEYDNISITDIIKFYSPITKMKRGTKCTYTNNTDCTTKCTTNWTTNCSPNCSPNCTPTLDNIDKLENIENINNKENYIYNNTIIENEKTLELVTSEEADVLTSTSTEEDKKVGANAVPLNQEIYSKLVKEIEDGCSNVRLNSLISEYFYNLSELDRKELKEYYNSYHLRKAS